MESKEIVWRLAAWLGPEGMGAAAGWLLWLRAHRRAETRRRERRRELEQRSYAGLNLRLGAEGEVREMARRVCRAISERSAFRRVAMLVRQSDGRLAVTASTGMEEAAVGALEVWAEGMMTEERGCGSPARWSADGGLGVRLPGGSFAVVLGKMPAEIGLMRAVVIPLWSLNGRMLGALALGADGLLTARRSVLREVLEPLEALALKVARTLENAALAERLMRAERLAGLGLLAGGMAHALNHPLTAVLGFAELIGGTSEEGRVREDAAVIVREALKMRRTVESLLEFSRPAGQGGQLVDMAGLVREVAAECAERLESRGVRLVVEGDGEELLVRGNWHRLRQLLEHLLNNAAQAVGGGFEGQAQEGGAQAGEAQAIRMVVSGGDGVVHVMVSDTGPGFREPAGVFDPFAMTEVAGAGLGLSLCYGIVHEHGGEISAFNLAPHGAAVAVELPRSESAVEETTDGVREAVSEGV